MKIIIYAAMILVPIFCEAKTKDWIVKSGTLQYTMKHMLHTVVGVSKELKGIGKCDSSCRFLVAAPVKSFSSDNANRDTNMQNFTRAALFPMVEMRTALSPTEGDKKTDIEIKFAGKTKSYTLPINIVKEAGGLAVKAIIPMKLSDFSIDRPALLGVKTDDDVPVSVELHLGEAN